MNCSGLRPIVRGLFVVTLMSTAAPIRAWGQTVNLNLSSGTVARGASVSLNLAISATGSVTPAAVEFAIGYSTTDISSIAVTVGAAATAAGKSVVCNPRAGSTICVAYGINAYVIANGTLAVVTLGLSPTTTNSSTAISVTSATVSGPTGIAISATPSGGTVTITTVIPPPTVSSLSCSPATVTGPGTSTCNIVLSAAAGAGGVTVAITSNSLRVSVPGTVNIGVGAATASFTATATAVIVNEADQMTAALNGSSMSAPLTVQAPAASVSRVSITPGGGTFTTSVDVTLSTLTAGATIYYTLDGSTPNATSRVYASPIHLMQTGWVRTFAAKTGAPSSSVSEFLFTIQQPPAPPSISPNGGTFSTCPDVALSTATAGAAINYTLDGSTPTAASALYGQPIHLTQSAAVSAKAFLAGVGSTTSQATFTVNCTGGSLAPPAISPAGGTFTTSVDVTLTAGSGASIYYTMDGSTPSASSTLYAAPIHMTHSGWVRTLAVKTGSTPSGVAESNFTIQPASGAGFTTRLNAGGTVYNDPQGNVWSPDSAIAGTLTFQTQNPIRNTDKSYLYQSERFSLGAPFQYVVPNVPTGTYNVRLLFAETYFIQPGKRIFSVNINGATALTNFDILAAAGGSNTAIDTVHTVNVTNGQITIQFVPVLSNPKISAIEIVPQTVAISVAPGLSDPLPPGAMQQFTPTLIGTANQNVTWTVSPNIGSITAGGLYTAGAVANPAKVTLTATSAADPSKSATATVQLVPQAWASQDVGPLPVAGSTTYVANSFSLQGWGDLSPATDTFRYAYTKLIGDGSIIAQVDQPYTGGTFNKSGVMMRNDLSPSSAYASTAMWASIVGLFEWRQAPGTSAGYQFGPAGLPWMRLTRTGNTVTSYVSSDATSWIPAGPPQTLTAPGVYAGLFAANGGAPVLNSVTFDGVEVSASPVAVAINEGLTSLAASQTAQFTALVTGSANTGVTWSISPVGQGSINPATGVYTAPAAVANPSLQTVAVTATSQADPSKSASVIVLLGGFLPIRVNCGGPSHYDPTGVFWSGDLGAVGGAGNIYNTGHPIANTLTPYLYLSERFLAGSTLSYKYYVPNGNYQVKLKFAEIYFTSPNQRVMNISVNGSVVDANFDVFTKAGGAFTALDKTYSVTVTNGQILIALAPAVAGHTPKISAIEIQ